jgi:bile acid-coenzyme A ligase
MDAEGYLYVADRLDDVIVTGGVKVHPADVEAAIEAHPDVRSSVVVPRDHDERGQVVHAVVDVDAADVTEEALLRWVRARLDPEKVPRSWQLVREQLRDDTGKVRRRDHR